MKIQKRDIEEIFSLLSNCVSNKNKGFLVNLKYKDFENFCVRSSSGYRLNPDGRSVY